MDVFHVWLVKCECCSTPACETERSIFQEKPRDKSYGHFAHEYYGDVYLEC